MHHDVRSICKFLPRVLLVYRLTRIFLPIPVRLRRLRCGRYDLFFYPIKSNSFRWWGRDNVVHVVCSPVSMSDNAVWRPLCAQKERYRYLSFPQELLSREKDQRKFYVYGVRWRYRRRPPFRQSRHGATIIKQAEKAPIGCPYIYPPN